MVLRNDKDTISHDRRFDIYFIPVYNHTVQYHSNIWAEINIAFPSGLKNIKQYIFAGKIDTALASRVVNKTCLHNETFIVQPFWNNLGGPTAEAIEEERQNKGRHILMTKTQKFLPFHSDDALDMTFKFLLSAVLSYIIIL